MKRSKVAFSLAEMLLVVAVLSCIAVTVSSFAVKKNKTPTVKQERGRYECFYKDNVLTQRYTISGKPSGETTPSTCIFNPAVAGNADFLAFTAIGGGGGGAWAPMPTEYEDKRSSSSATGVLASVSMPDWAHELETSTKKVTSWSQTLYYSRLTEGRGGGAGEARTVYLSRPGLTSCTATVGKGGAAATSTSTASGFGEETEIKCNGRTIVKAAGGIGSNEYTVTPLLMDGMDGFNGGDPPKKPGGLGQASNYMADDAAAEKSQGTISDSGYGGRGGGSTINQRSATHLRSYSINNGTESKLNISDTGKKGANTCGQNNPNERAQNGKPGAFIVTW